MPERFLRLPGMGQRIGEFCDDVCLIRIEGKRTAVAGEGAIVLLLIQ